MLFWAEHVRGVCLINQDPVRKGQSPRSQMFRLEAGENRKADGRGRQILVPHHFLMHLSSPVPCTFPAHPLSLKGP